MWLSPTPIGIGTGECGGDCYFELPRIPLLSSWVNRAKRRSEVTLLQTSEDSMRLALGCWHRTELRHSIGSHVQVPKSMLQRLQH
jgi:hypothetical protein